MVEYDQSFNAQKNKNEEELSRTVFWMRTIALIAICTAHATYIKSSSCFFERLCTSFSDSGVAIFLFASGVYWKWSPIGKTIKNIGKLIIPWALFGSLTYIFSNYSSGIKIVDLFAWLGGGKHLFMVSYSVL